MSGRALHLGAWVVAIGASVGVVAGRVAVEPERSAATVASAPPAPARTTTVTRTVTVASKATPRRRRTPSAVRAGRSRPAAAPAATRPRRVAAAPAPTRRRRPSRSGSKAPSTSSPAPAGPQQVDGDAVATRYGTIQVRLVLSGSRISDVVVLAAPTDGGERTRQITADAMPRLRQQVIAAQSTQIDGVAGATYTTQGYRQSVQSALDLA